MGTNLVYRIPLFFLYSFQQQKQGEIRIDGSAYLFRNHSDLKLNDFTINIPILFRTYIAHRAVGGQATQYGNF